MRPQATAYNLFGVDWYFAAIFGAFLFAVVSIFDKRLVEHHFPSFWAFNISFGLIHFFTDSARYGRAESGSP